MLRIDALNEAMDRSEQELVDLRVSLGSLDRDTFLVAVSGIGVNATSFSFSYDPPTFEIEDDGVPVEMESSCAPCPFLTKDQDMELCLERRRREVEQVRRSLFSSHS